MLTGSSKPPSSPTDNVQLVSIYLGCPDRVFPTEKPARRKVCMAASVAAVEGHRDCSSIWNSGLRPINASKRRYASTASSSDDRLRARGKPKEDNGNQSEESLQRVMYLNCWTQS
ncbi:Protein of unknown function wound-induced - like 6 [Theobroma cacao]|nr:Protein of unknown function wound-induced - like 6 [Theobroma cacao]